MRYMFQKVVNMGNLESIFFLLCVIALVILLFVDLRACLKTYKEIKGKITKRIEALEKEVFKNND